MTHSWSHKRTLLQRLTFNIKGVKEGDQDEAESSDQTENRQVLPERTGCHHNFHWSHHLDSAVSWRFGEIRPGAAVICNLIRGKYKQVYLTKRCVL